MAGLLSWGQAADAEEPSGPRVYDGDDGERILILQELSPWTDLPAIPGPVQEIYPAVVGDKIVVGGGFGKAEKDAKGPRIEDRCFIYDAAGKTWKEGPNLPVKRHHFYLVDRGEAVLAMGGYEVKGDKIWNMQAGVFTLNAGQTKWSPGPDLPVARGEFAAGSIDGTVIVTAGRKKVGEKTGDRGDHTNAPETILLKPGASEWVKGKPIPSVRMSCAAVVLNGRLHVLGGRVQTGDKQSSYTNSTAHESYEPVTDSWKKHAPLPKPVAGIAATAMDGKLFLFGGEDDKPPYEVYTHVWIYDPAKNQWTEEGHLPRPLHGHGAVTMKDGIHLLGGSILSGGTGTTDRHSLLAPAKD
jgi:N-acetylneuraminic acid mutarotase